MTNPNVGKRIIKVAEMCGILWGDNVGLILAGTEWCVVPKLD